MANASRSFDGETFDPRLDGKRLTSQLDRVREFMLSDLVKYTDGWEPLWMIVAKAGGSEAGVSARLRDLRKPRFGGYIVERRRKAGCRSVWEYRVLRPPSKPEQMRLLA